MENIDDIITDPIDFTSYRTQFDIINKNCKFPEKVLFYGNGLTVAPDEWLEYPRIVFNLGRICDNLFGIICSKSNFHKAVELSNNTADYYFVFGVRRRSRSIYNEDNKSFYMQSIHRHSMIREVFRNVKGPSTGHCLIYYLLYSSIKEIYIAGFDGYEQKEEYGCVYADIWGGASISNRHPLNLEWQLIKKAIDIARIRGMKVTVATLPSFKGDTI
jgi:hypothetical protein